MQSDNIFVAIFSCSTSNELIVFWYLKYKFILQISKQKKTVLIKVMNILAATQNLKYKNYLLIT